MAHHTFFTSHIVTSMHINYVCYTSVTTFYYKWVEVVNFFNLIFCCVVATCIFDLVHDVETMHGLY